MTATTPLNPGGQAAPGAGENICSHCKGRCRVEDGQPCPICDGSGKVIEGIGGG